jgi:hypothetical protein
VIIQSCTLRAAPPKNSSEKNPSEKKFIRARQKIILKKKRRAAHLITSFVFQSAALYLDHDKALRRCQQSLSDPRYHNLLYFKSIY